ncbi:hypothetical protein FACS189473_5570 [Spirochaetia bacterium]|nr:hypothetical protein FACS189473_5570 [Spirochaetia bacterium]GHV81901.1 hypothetical protein AGMMS49991_04590 [Spirochaetia bacterium]
MKDSKAKARRWLAEDIIVRLLASGGVWNGDGTLKDEYYQNIILPPLTPEERLQLFEFAEGR